MSKDFQKKQPTKNEQMLYELAMHQDRLQNSLWTTSSFLTAVSFLLKVDADKVAELMVNGNDQIKEYSQKINAKIDQLEKEKHAKEHPEHNHGAEMDSAAADAVEQAS